MWVNVAYLSVFTHVFGYQPINQMISNIRCAFCGKNLPVTGA